MEVSCKFSWGAMLSVVLIGCANGAEDLAIDGGEASEVGVSAEEMKNANLIDVSGAVVEFRNFDNDRCTGTLIDKDTLITAAHCGRLAKSHTDLIRVLYQVNSTTWRCLTAVDATTGNQITGTHEYVANKCRFKTAGFGSMYDYGTESLAFPGNDPNEWWTTPKHDFAVVKIWESGFRWVGTSNDNYAGLYTGSIALNANEWAYGTGHNSNSSIDYRVRSDIYNVQYVDNYVIGAFGVNAQLCSGDSGGPLGVFVSNPARFALVGVASTVPEWGSTTPDVICGINSGATYWSNAVTRVWYVEKAIGKTCRSVNHNGIIIKECWD